MTKQEECKTGAAGQFARMVDEEHWMSLFLTSKDGVVVLEETTCGFPINAHQSVLQLIEEALKKKTPIITQPMLPLAKHLLNGEVVEKEPAHELDN